MADTQTSTFEGIMRDLRARKYAPIYYLMGEEPYYIDQIADYIANNVLKEEERDFNQTVVFGSDVSMAQVVDMAKRYPMMAEHQVVIVKEAQNIKNTDALAAYLSHPQTSTILVMCHKNGSIDRRKKIVAELDKAGVLFESKKLRERDLPQFIENYLKKRGVAIDRKSVCLIADSIGSDLNRLTGELEKIIVSLQGEDRKVTPDIVESMIGVSKDFNAFELRDAIVSKNAFKANQIVKYFDENPKAGNVYSILPIIFNYFQNLMIAYYCPQRNNQEAVAKWLELRSSWAAKDYMTGMRNYTAKKVMRIIAFIRETDAKSKGIDNVSTSAGELMRELVYFILH